MKDVTGFGEAEAQATSIGDAVEICCDGASYVLLLPQRETDYIQGKIAGQRLPYEHEMLQDVRARVRSGDLVVDVGANIGNHTLYLAAVVGCTVVACEPNEALARALAASVALNELGATVTVMPVAVGREPTRGHLIADRPDNLGAQKMRLGEGEVEVVRLDDLVLRPAVRMIKIDVEGMELDVLAGAEALIVRDRPILYVECQAEAAFRAVIGWLGDRFYRLADTFNATPTHLFLHSSEMPAEQHSDAMHRRIAQESYRSARYFTQLRYRIDESAKRQRASEASVSSKLDALDARQPDASLVLSRVEDTLAKIREVLTSAAMPGVRTSRPSAGLLAKVNLSVLEDPAIAGEAATDLMADLCLLRTIRQAEIGRSAAEGLALGLLRRDHDKLRGDMERLLVDYDDLRLQQRQLVHLARKLARGLEGASREAWSLRRSVRYRLGDVLAAASTSLKGLLRAPVALRRAMRATEAAAPSRLPDWFEEIRACSAPSKAHRASEVQPPSETQAPRLVPEQLSNLRVAVMGSGWFQRVLGYECPVLPLAPHRWRADLTAFRPSLILIEWETDGGEQPTGIRPQWPGGELAGDVLAWCREHRVATIAWLGRLHDASDAIAGIVSKVDAVFTTDVESVAQYRRMRGRGRVGLLLQGCPRGPSAAWYREAETEGTNDTLIDSVDAAQECASWVSPSDPASQTAVNWRLYEALASKRLVATDHARSVEMVFGDLVVHTSDRDLARNLLSERARISIDAERIRLAGWRKVIWRNTMQDRLAAICNQLGLSPTIALPEPCIALAAPRTRADVVRIAEAFRRQNHPNKRLVIVVEQHLLAQARLVAEEAECLDSSEADRRSISTIAAGTYWLGGLSAADHYGANYLLDLVLTARFTAATIVGKPVRFRWMSGQDALRIEHALPEDGARFSVRSSIVRVADLEGSIGDWVKRLADGHFPESNCLEADRFNYCKDAVAPGFGSKHLESIDDLPLDTGLSESDIGRIADMLPPAEDWCRSLVEMDGAELACQLLPPVRQQVVLSPVDGRLAFSGASGERTFEYWYLRSTFPLQEVATLSGLKVHLSGRKAAGVLLAVICLGAHGQRLQSSMCLPNRNYDIRVPLATREIRLALRFACPASGAIDRVTIGRETIAPPVVIGRGSLLVVTPQYPSDSDRYKNMFIHSRVLAYRAAGQRVDVFRLREDEALRYHDYEGQTCITGSAQALCRLIEGGHHRGVLVHFLNETTWRAIVAAHPQVPIVVWVHGFEIQPWTRRTFNIQDPSQLSALRTESDRKVAFWRESFAALPPNVHLVFVSRTFANEVFEDIAPLPPERFSIIANPIDTTLFPYEPKPLEHRLRVLSIRPYSSRVYANDLMVGAILLLARQPYFWEFSFTIVGDGPLFEETVAPLRAFTNVTLEKTFLSHAEIAIRHKNHGVFLCPSRYDSQGVSRDEAMSSGLVPVTTRVGAIPEFVDDDSGMVVAPESFEALAQALEKIRNSPIMFAKLSARAAEKVRTTRDICDVTERELLLVGKMVK